MVYFILLFSFVVVWNDFFLMIFFLNVLKLNYLKYWLIGIFLGRFRLNEKFWELEYGIFILISFLNDFNYKVDNLFYSIFLMIFY